jgi:putative nucleotidyltransferase with HDIG domain
MMRCKPVEPLDARPSLNHTVEGWLEQLTHADEDQGADFGHLDETEGILFALAQAVEQRDRHTAGHCERLALIGVAIGMAMKLSRADLLTLYRGGYLHDIGKVGIPDSILFKEGQLTAEEWIIMRSHSERGEEICRPMKTLAPVLPIIRSHHERWDGSGYPDNLSREQIPLLARVLQVADIYDALTSPRPYKAACTPLEALAIMDAETARGWRDPELMQLFFRMHGDVISRIAGHDGPDRGMDSVRTSMRNLQRYLAGSAKPLARHRRTRRNAPAA